MSEKITCSNCGMPVRMFSTICPYCGEHPDCNRIRTGEKPSIISGAGCLLCGPFLFLALIAIYEGMFIIGLMPLILCAVIGKGLFKEFDD